MSKVNLENLIYKKPSILFGVNLLNGIYKEANMDGDDENDLPLDPESPDPAVDPVSGTISQNEGTGGQ